MADADWHYLVNQFDNATKESKKRMKLIAFRHLAALGAAPSSIKAGLIARVTPAKTAFDDKYNLWRNLLAQRAGAVVTFGGLIDKLSSTDIEDIETAFKGVHKRGSAEHTVAFAGGRAPYQEGSDDERVDALANLLTRVNDTPGASLAAVATLITSVLTPLQEANQLISELEAKIDQTRPQIEPLRVALALALYQNLAALMQELGPSEEIAAFFDLELLRQTGPEEEEIVPVTPGAPVVPPQP